MASENHGAVARGIERIFNQGSLVGLTEAQLLRRFATGDEDAFESLVKRLGPMVLGACRRLLYDPRDVEDAFQATFLVLLRRAGSLRDAESLGPWLHGVAYRVAARVRSRSARRPGGESKAARPEAVWPVCDLERGELRAMIDEEIRRLPEKYRRPVVLCYLEGRSHEEAARRLRCSAGSVRGRLDRARRKLQGRLIRRGVAPAAGLAALAAGGEAVSATVPASMTAATVATLARAATARAVSSASPVAIELAESVFRGMVAAKLRLAASFLLAGAIVMASGAAWLVVLGDSFAHDGLESPPPVAPRGSGSAGGPETPRGDGSSIEIRVVDRRTERPLPGVALTLEADRNPRRRATTDDAGRAVVALPSPPPKELWLGVRKEGFVPVRLWFLSLSLGEDVVGEGIPASYTLKMYPVETLGGVVKDELGNPIAGVRVLPRARASSGRARSIHEDFEELAPALTDAQGRWQCAGMPAGIDLYGVSIAFTHPEYQRVDLPNGQALETLRSGKPTVLPRGLEVTGRVVDAAGRPILGALVIPGKEFRGPVIPRATTDADGRFRLDRVSAGESVLTVQARGYAPALQEVVVRPGLAPVVFRLAKGRAIRGRVVDAQGEPLAGATVSPAAWHGYTTLQWRATTDEDGTFQWTDAPPDSFWINVGREGYLDVHHHEVAPTDVDLTIKLVRPLKVRGTVVDAETRHAIPSFTLVPGDEGLTGSPTRWRRIRARTAGRGQYRIQFFGPSMPEGRRLRIEADGYLPVVSRVIRDDEDDPVVNFVLHRGTGVSGIVRSPDKAALVGADVVLVDSSEPASIGDGLLANGDHHWVSKTDAQGHFRFPPQEPPYTIVVLHDRGFAEQKVGDARTELFALTAQPWGRVEGTLRIGNRPGAGEMVRLVYPNQADRPDTLPWWNGYAKSDEAGRFLFERVIPGEVIVSRSVPLHGMGDRRTLGQSHGTRVGVRAGEATRTNLGGTGRPVVGRLTAPADFPGPISWIFSLNHLTPKETAMRGKSSHLGVAKGPQRATSGWSVALKADGSFRIEDVETGSYELSFGIYEPPRDPSRTGVVGDLIATARREVVILEMPGGRSDEPLDLGEIPLTIKKSPAATSGGIKP